MKKRALFLVAMLLVLMAALTVTTSAAQSEGTELGEILGDNVQAAITADGLEYAYNDTQVVITGYSGTDTTATCYYPAGNATWDAIVAANEQYGGALTWEKVYVAEGTCGENLTWTLDTVLLYGLGICHRREKGYS